MASDKTAVIKYLFDKFYDPSTGTFSKSVMSLEDVQEAIVACNALDGLKRSARNPANFLKDLVRKKSASTTWPIAISKLRYTGEQRTGSGDSFEFVPFEPNQNEAFPDLFRPNESSLRVALQSVSLPQYARELGRTDEAWLTQTAVNLRVVEHHMATQSDIDVREILHLQMNVKLRATEIDAIYRASLAQEGSRMDAIITCEAKNQSERILVDQITSQVTSAFETMKDVAVVIPLAIRSVSREGIQVIEFDAVHRDDVGKLKKVRYRRDVVYRLIPAVQGISI